MPHVRMPRPGARACAVAVALVPLVAAPAARAAAQTSTPAAAPSPHAAPHGAPSGHHPAPAPGRPARTVAVLLYDGFNPLDMTGPMQMLGMLRMQGWRVVTVARARGPVRADAGYGVEAQAAFAELPRVDVLVVPGGLEGTYRAARDTAVTGWVRRASAHAQAVASVCTGAWVLAGAGVLARGDTAATHWLGGDELARHGVAYTPARVHHAGKVWTAAGVSAGIDLGLALTAAIGGRALAEHSQLAAQYAPEPPFDAGSPEKAPAEAARMRAMHAALMRGIARRAAADSAAAARQAVTAAGRAR